MLEKILLIGFVLMLMDQDTSKSVPRPVSIRVWLAKLHKIERTRPTPKNSAGVQEAKDALEARVKKACDGVRVKFSTSVSSVHWRDGYVTIFTQDEVKATRKASAGIARIKRIHGFSAEMSQSDAASIKKGTRLRIDAFLRFYKGHLQSSDKNGFAMYSVYVPGISGAPYSTGTSGTCCTTDYTIELGETELIPRWTKEGGPIRAKETPREAPPKEGGPD